MSKCINHDYPGYCDAKDKQIAKLEAENQRLRDALEKIKKLEAMINNFGSIYSIAKQALEDTQK